MNTATRTMAWLCFLLSSSGMARADVITDWNEKAVAAGYTARTGPAFQARFVAMAHIAMFEAVNSIEPRYAAYRKRLPVEAGASNEAAAAAAAHDILVLAYPDQAKDFDKLLESSLAAVADGPAKANGMRVGHQAAEAILSERRNDGADSPNDYRPYTTAGKYVPTLFPVFSSWGRVKPFALASGDAVRPAAPYPLTSEQWARDYNEVRTMGAKTGSGRSAEQTDIARFWEQVGPATYNPMVRQIAAAKGLDLLDNARLFALVSIATADALVAVFDAKYTYNFWRPVTAIRNGDIDGNDATTRDPLWEPFISTPVHPEYPCAHCITQGAAATVLQNIFGDMVPRFNLTSPTAPGVTRSFMRLSDYVAEVVNARVYDGVHYRTSGEVGAAMGKKVGDITTQNLLKPLR